MRKVIIGPSSFAEFDKSPIELLKYNNIEYIPNTFGRKITENELRNLLSGDVIASIAGLETYSKEIIEKSKLKIISRVGSGIDNIDMDYAMEKNVKIFNTPDGPTNSVSELTVSMMINLVRGSINNINSLKNKNWNRSVGFEISSKNIVVVGYGRIGKKVANILSSFCKNIYIVDPYVKSKKFKNISFKDSLDIAEIYTLHTNSKDLLFNEKILKKLKNRVYLLNSSRAHNLTDETIIYGIENDIIRGVWLDVFHNEPYTQGILFDYPQIIMTPHIASYTVECRKKMELESVKNLIENLDEF